VALSGPSERRQRKRDKACKVHSKFQAAKAHVRKYRLFAKSKTKAAKDRMVAQMTSIIEGINQNLGKAIAAASAQGRKLRGHAVVAQRKLLELHEAMGKLVPQIRHWLRTGFVASGKIINLHWHHQALQIRIQPPGGTLSRDDGRVRPTGSAWAEPHQAASGRCRKEGDCPGGMSETRGPRSPLRAKSGSWPRRSMGWPDIAICSPNFPTSSS
jgi:hypothetical protein